MNFSKNYYDIAIIKILHYKPHITSLVPKNEIIKDNIL
jgi:hypothetical protein